MRRLLASWAAALAAAAAGAAEMPLWFPVGEQMTYDIHWGIFHVGTTEVTTGWTNHEGRALLAIRYVTRTNKFVEKLYPVEDELETLIDPETFLPVRFTKNAREGKHRSNEVTVFDHAAGEARFTNLLKDRTRTFAIDPDTRDVIAMMYWLRREPFAVGQERTYRVMADEKLYDLSLRVPREEKVKLDRYGRLACHQVEPEAAFNGLFVRKGRLIFWVSEDERRVCTKMVGEVPVASIKVTLREVRGPGDDAWVAPAGKPEDGKK